MMPVRPIFALAAAVAMLAGLTVADNSAHARSKIEIIVNDVAITSYQINQRARLLRLVTRKGAAHTKRLARQELIDETLQLHEAKRRGMSVNQAQVDAAFGSIAKNAKLTPSRLSSILKRSGVNPATLKQRLRAQIAWSTLLRRRFQATVKVREQEVVNALRQKEDDDTPKVTYMYDLRQVIYIIPAKAPKSYLSQQRRAAKSLRSRFSSCADLEQLRGQRDIVVKKIGKRLEADLRTEQREALKDIGANQLAKPQEKQGGIEVLAVCSKETLESDATARSLMEEELREKKGDLLSRRYIRELRRNAVIIEK